MASWQVQNAKARFSEFLDASLKEGPQIVTRRGVEAAVLVPIAEWRKLQRASRPSLKDLLLAPQPRFENLIPSRRTFKRRPPVRFE
ncbi:MAG: type II toxin-antitoxin system Phd/YefM family antitoxin [Bryobacteraceae bacterium]